MKKTILIIAIIFSLGILFLVNMERNLIINNEKDVQTEYSFKITEKENLNSVLSEQKYYYTTDYDKKYISVITCKSDTAVMNQFLTKNGDVIELEMPYDSTVVISLPANRTIAYGWSLDNMNDNSLLQLYDYSWIKIPGNIIGTIKDGENYDRQNFYFKASAAGNEDFTMRYQNMSDQSMENEDCFEINFKITMQK